MRALLLALVLANVLAFAWWQGLLDPWLAAGRDPDRVSRQVEPAKVRVVPIERLEAARRAAQGGCWEVGPLAEDRFERALAWARAQGAKAEAQPAKPILRLRFASSATDAERRTGLAEFAAESAGEPRPCEPATAGSATQGSATQGSATPSSGASTATGAPASAPAGASSASPAGAPPSAAASASSKAGTPAAASASSKAGTPAAASASSKTGTPAAASASSKAGTPAAASASSKANSPEAEGGSAK